MVANQQNVRSLEHRLYWLIAILFLLVVLAGFARTYYLKFAFAAPPLPGTLVHLHGILMTAWVALFLTQVYLISAKRIKAHMSLGMLGVALAAAIIPVGILTGAAAAKYGSTASPPDISPLSFFIVPFVDMVYFAVVFGLAIYYRKRAADHKRLMLLTVINFLPPAVARLPIAPLQALGPLFFFGVPTLAAIILLIYDTRKHGKLNKLFAAGAAVLIVSYPLRLVISSTGAWMDFAAWVTAWAV